MPRRDLCLGAAMILALAAGLGLSGCGSDEKTAAPQLKAGTCLGCHGDAGKLQATVTPGAAPAETDPGEG